MNEHILKGNWNELKGKLKQKYGKLTDDDLTVIEGKHDEIFGVLEKHYGYTKDQIKKDLETFDHE